MREGTETQRRGSQAFNQAVAHHRAGRLEEAERLYRQVDSSDVRAADALHLRGVVALELGRPDEALALIEEAIAADPEKPAYRLSLGQVHTAAGRVEEAVCACRRATELDPLLADAWFGLGRALQTAKREREAIEVYRKLLALAPDHADGCHNLASVLELCGDLEEAIVFYERALALEPGCAATHNNLSSALFRSGRLEEAIAAARKALELQPDSTLAMNNLACALTADRRIAEAVDVLGRAIALAPDFPEAWYNLAKALGEQGKLGEAAVACRRALSLRPNCAQAHIALGNALQATRQFEEAIACYREALKLSPSDAEAYSNLGNALRSQGKLDQAISAFRTCVSLRPDFHVGHCNLGNALKDTGLIEEAVACYRRAVDLSPSDVVSHSNLAYAVHYHPDYDAAAILAEHRRYSAMHAAPLENGKRDHGNKPDPDRRLRIGYVGADFREHCQSLFMTPLLSSHNHDQFDIFCYSNVARPDSVTERLRGYADGWRETACWIDEEMARQVQADAIDILVDLTMHMSNGRPLLMARKPAPIQVAWLAYPGTTGLTAVDYRFTDPYLDPPGETDANYVEQSIRLPDTFWCYEPLANLPAASPDATGTPERLTFGCLNNFCKVTDVSLALWSRVLRAVEGSRFLLLAPPGEHRGRVLDRFREAEIEPARIEFVEPRPRSKYLELYQRVDVCLDTLPYNGHTTSLDAIWMGVPVVTRVGRTIVGRAGYSQLSNLGLSDLVAASDDEFVRIASMLARDMPRRRELRGTLRGRMQRSPLMDAARFTRNVETAYRNMWQHWCREQRPNGN